MTGCKKQIESFNVVAPKIVFSKIELNKIYHIAGYLIANINKRERVCQTCISATGSKNSNNNFYSALTRLRSKHASALFYVHPITFNFFLQMTKIFMTYYPHLRSKTNINMKQLFVQRCNEIAFSLPTCHNLKEKIIRRYISFRLKISSRALPSSNQNGIRASKSMVMHAYVK